MWPKFCRKTIRICFIDLIHLIIRFQVILVNVSLPNSGYKYLPDSRWARLHSVGRCVPIVEIADDSDPLCIRGPYGKLSALPPVSLGKMCAKLLICAVKGAFCK